MSQSKRLLLIGSYAVLLAVQVGAVLMDQTYAHVLQSGGGNPSGAASAADLLLMLLMVVALAGVLSLFATEGRARLLVLGSLAICSLNILVPMAASVLNGGSQWLVHSGPLLRLVIQPGTLLFALLAARELLVGEVVR